MPPKNNSPDKDRARQIFERLRKRYPKLRSALDWGNAWELLVATVLAAQCTDARVNTVTPTLFGRWPGPAELAQASQADLEEVVRSTGFFRNKAKNLIGAAKAIMAEHGGRVPRTMDELTALPGLARKTANIVLSGAFGINEGLAVDTHVKRLAFRMGLTESTNPVIIERDLMPLFEQKDWGDVNHALVLFGREVCAARSPKCADCPVAGLCPQKGVK